MRIGNTADRPIGPQRPSPFPGGPGVRPSGAPRAVATGARPIPPSSAGGRPWWGADSALTIWFVAFVVVGSSLAFFSGVGGASTASHTAPSTGALPGISPSPSTPTPAAAQSSAIGTLSAGPLVAQTPSTFWSLVLQANCARCVATDPAVGAFINQTPFVWFRYSQMSDQCNLSANVVYDDSGKVTGHCGSSPAAFQQWCNSRTPHCRSIFDLPGENNNSGEVAAIAKYIVQTVGFQPNYWSIGNEPSLWKHYGIPWAQWKTTDHSAATPLSYALDVKAGIKAVLGVDPGAHFIGVQAPCECDTAWFQETARINGPQISAIAYHTYPSSGGRGKVTLQQFLDPLASPSNITASYASVRTAIRGSCTTCGTMPILIDEFNAGPGVGPSNHAGTYENAVFIAASVVQALRANVSQLTVFDLQTYSPGAYGFSLMNARDGVGPTGVLYSKLLSHLVNGKVYTAPIRTSVPSVWSVLTNDGSNQSLLVVNANLTQSLSLGLGAVLPTTGTADIYRWAPGLSVPSATLGTSVVGTYTVPAEGMLLIRMGMSLVGPPSLTVNATHFPVQGVPPLDVKFIGAASGGTSPYSFKWVFGDGNTSSAPSPTHSYATPGQYTATVTVTGVYGHAARSSVTTDVAKPLTLTLHANVTNGSVPFCVSFHASPGGGMAPYAIHWNFTFGAKTARGVSTTHCFKSTGIFPVVATVVDASGDAHSTTLYIGAKVPTGFHGLVAMAFDSSAAPQGLFPDSRAAPAIGDSPVLNPHGPASPPSLRGPTHSARDVARADL